MVDRTLKSNYYYYHQLHVRLFHKPTLPLSIRTSCTHHTVSNLLSIRTSCTHHTVSNLLPIRTSCNHSHYRLVQDVSIATSTSTTHHSLTLISSHHQQAFFTQLCHGHFYFKTVQTDQVLLCPDIYL